MSTYAVVTDDDTLVASCLDLRGGKDEIFLDAPVYHASDVDPDAQWLIHAHLQYPGWGVTHRASGWGWASAAPTLAVATEWVERVHVQWEGGLADLAEKWQTEVEAQDPGWVDKDTPPVRNPIADEMMHAIHTSRPWV